MRIQLWNSTGLVENAMPDASTISDVDIVLMLMERDPSLGLRLLYEKHSGKVIGLLKKRFKGVLDEAEVKSAFNLAVAQFLKQAAKYDETKGALGGLLYAFTRNAAVSVLRREQKHYENRTNFDEALRDDVAENLPCDEPPTDSKQGKVLADFDAAIASLSPVQQAIIRADLKADGLANADRLAEQLGCSTNSIYVNRNRARESLRKRMIDLGHYRA